MAIPNVASWAGTLLLAFALYKLSGLIRHLFTSPLRDLPGPKSPNWIYGNMKDIFKADNSVLHEQWVEEYGPTMTYAGFMSVHRLFTMDTKALNHILMHSDNYQKPEQVRYNLARILGTGVLFVEGDQHKQQRKIMNPAFGPTQIRELTDIFVEKSIQLRDIWSSEIAKSGGAESARIDVLSWLSKMTLDVIGLAGFNYKFDALNPELKSNELNEAFSTLFHAGHSVGVLPRMKEWFPILRLIPTERDRNIKRAQKTMGEIGNKLLREAKASIRDGAVGSKEKHRDLFSLLIHANMASDVKEAQRLSDDNVLAQISTMTIAGHETSSTAVTWALYALTQAPEVQTKLREELLDAPSDEPTMDELNALPYLDAVVREMLRLHAPVASTVRIATHDDVIPLSTPFVDRKGITRDNIKVSKGDSIFIPILAINRSKALWGEDAMEFKPERWESPPEAISGIPGVWGHLMTFLGGPRACIGYRFSLVEIKALLFVLVRAFEFELAVPPQDIIKKSLIVQRPFVVSDPQHGNQMPLLIKPVKEF